MNILLTRPYKDSLKLKQRIEAASQHQCTIKPMLEIELLQAPAEIPSDAVVIITSANGIRALAQNTENRDIRIITVGKYSAAKAIKRGFAKVESAVDGDNQNASEANLFNYIAKNVEKGKRLIHISANITKGGLKKRLVEAGYKYEKKVLYNSHSVAMDDELVRAIASLEYQAYCFFSPRTAAIFASQVIEMGLENFLHEAVAFCFSEAVVKGLSGLNLKKIYIPEVTTTENFVKLLCDHKG